MIESNVGLVLHHSPCCAVPPRAGGGSIVDLSSNVRDDEHCKDVSRWWRRQPTVGTIVHCLMMISEEELHKTRCNTNAPRGGYNDYFLL